MTKQVDIVPAVVGTVVDTVDHATSAVRNTLSDGWIRLQLVTALLTSVPGVMTALEHPMQASRESGIKSSVSHPERPDRNKQAMYEAIASGSDPNLKNLFEKGTTGNTVITGSKAPSKDNGIRIS